VLRSDIAQIFGRHANSIRIHFHLEPHVKIARVTGELIELWSCVDPRKMEAIFEDIVGRRVEVLHRKVINLCSS
jgi:hypothetical protein